MKVPATRKLSFLSSWFIWRGIYRNSKLFNLDLWLGAFKEVHDDFVDTVIINLCLFLFLLYFIFCHSSLTFTSNELTLPFTFFTRALFFTPRYTATVRNKTKSTA